MFDTNQKGMQEKEKETNVYLLYFYIHKVNSVHK